MGLYVWKFGYRKVLEPLAKRLSWLDPDLVSYAAVTVSGLTALCYVGAGRHPGLLLLAIVLIFLRMTMNTIDGVMAIQRGKKTLVGEVVNALPDRYADVLLLLGLVFSPLCHAALAVPAMATVFLVSYTGMLGKAVGVSWQHQGPLGKVERLILLMIFSLLQFVFGNLSFLGISLGALSWGLVVYIVLGQVTVLNRLRGQLREIALKEWPDDPRRRALTGRVLVVYDSQTGNTQAVAEKIAETLSAPCVSARGPIENKKYDLVILGTPNIRGKGTRAFQEVLTKDVLKDTPYAVVVTYGAPLWGRPTALMLVRSVARTLGRKPCGYLLVKGYHTKFKTYRGRPNAQDKEKASWFAVKLARHLKEPRHG